MTSRAPITETLAAALLMLTPWKKDRILVDLFCGSGTINIDVCLNSLLPENKKILIVNNGAYSQRAVEICSYYGLPHIDLQFPADRMPR